ncbi:MAG TPA: hypothetical protein VFJ93_07790 [Gaiellaceae bacterium]|nr:hypothetical protein [Gaiellaceae bacterium]
MFAHADGYYDCCLCGLQTREWTEDPTHPLGGYLKAVGEKVETEFRTATGMIEHLEKHRAAGHTVPQDCIDELSDPKDEAENRESWRKRIPGWTPA